MRPLRAPASVLKPVRRRFMRDWRAGQRSWVRNGVKDGGGRERGHGWMSNSTTTMSVPKSRLPIAV